MTVATAGKVVKGTKASKGSGKPTKAPKAVAGGKDKRKAPKAVEVKVSDGRGIPLAENTIAVEGVKVNKAKVKAAGVTFQSSATGATRGTIYGHTITSVVRALSYHGVSKDGVRKVLVSFGLPSKEGMLRAQWGDGQRKANGLDTFHGEPAGLSGGELKALKALAGE